jgi:hypothetical protein
VYLKRLSRIPNKLMMKRQKKKRIAKIEDGQRGDKAKHKDNKTGKKSRV